MRRLLSLLLAISWCVPTSRAAIVYSGLQNIAVPFTFEGVYLDLDTSTYSLTEFAGWEINPFFAGQGIANSSNFQPVRVGTNPLDAYRAVAMGNIISASSSYFSFGEGGTDSNHIGLWSDMFHPGEDGLLGFAFTPSTGTTTFFGWMRLSLDPGNGTGVIRDWAYNSSANEGILAGLLLAAPEPGRSLILLAGIGPLVLRRRRPLPE